MAADVAAAVREEQGGVLIDLEVTPGAPVARFPHGFNPWRGRLGMRVRAPPEGGRANREVCALVAERLGVAPRAVTLAAGQTSTLKTVRIAGISKADLMARLGEVPA